MRKSTISTLVVAGAVMTAGCSTTIGYHNPSSSHQAGEITGTAVAHENMHEAAAAAVDQSDPTDVSSFVARHNIRLIDNAGQPAGTITLKQGRTGLLLVVEATGLTPGWHGIHIHATGTCEATFTSAGAHINHAENKAPHGLLNTHGPDDGDLPNIFADANGNVKAELFTTTARISETGNGQLLLDADGAAIVIHANPDDHASQPIGGAGNRVACGEIHSN